MNWMITINVGLFCWLNFSHLEHALLRDNFYFFFFFFEKRNKQKSYNHSCPVRFKKKERFVAFHYSQMVNQCVQRVIIIDQVHDSSLCSYH